MAARASLALAQVAQPLIDVRIMKAFDFDPKLERVRDPIVLSLIAGPAGSFVARVRGRYRCSAAVGRAPIDCCRTTSCCGGCATGSE
jgi:hypothetical protein